MKKVLILVAGVAFIASLSSCKKDWTCACTYGSDTSLNTSYTIPKAKKKDAQAACDVWGTGASLVGGSCDLKKK